MEDRVERLLQYVWGDRSGFIFLPYKEQPDRWHETSAIPYSGERTTLPDQNGKVDRYFCPVVFSAPQRKKEFALPTNVLWSDLDEADPNNCRLKPSIAWESSPGRYQALWFLSSEVPPDDAAALSKRIAYADGADKGGWDLTQVLRIPGSQNFKYESAPHGRILWARRSAYSVEEIRGAYPAVNGETHAAVEAQWTSVDEIVIQSAITSLPVGFRRRLTESPDGDRSLELQKLTRDLIRFGVAPEIVLHLIQRSTWNKFKGRNDEKAQLLKQVNSAVEAVAVSKEVSKQKIKARREVEVELTQDMNVLQWGDFMQVKTELRWLVEDAWVDSSVGFISGRSKSYKTWIALDLALSIVSGSSFLGRYPIARTGPVLLIQEEDPAPVLQERLRLIAKSKGMLPKLLEARDGRVRIEYPDYPLHIINLQGFSLGSTERVAQVRKLIAELNPVMVILDPLIVMMGDVEENRATAVSAVLQSVKMWREEFGCSIAIVHHWNKGKLEDGERAAEHMYGSFAFHAWLECAWHVRPVIEEGQERIDSVIIEREFKAAASGGSLNLRFHIDTIKDYTYSVEFDDKSRIGPKEQAALDSLAQAGAQTTGELCSTTGMSRSDVATMMGRMARAKLVNVRVGGGRGKSTIYWLPDQPEPPER